MHVQPVCFLLLKSSRPTQANQFTSDFQLLTRNVHLRTMLISGEQKNREFKLGYSPRTYVDARCEVWEVIVVYLHEWLFLIEFLRH